MRFHIKKGRSFRLERFVGNKDIKEENLLSYKDIHGALLPWIV